MRANIGGGRFARGVSASAVVLLATLFSQAARADLDVLTQGLFETATVVVSASRGLGRGASGTLAYRERGTERFQAALPFTQIDRHNLSTSLFHLKPATEYELQIDVSGHDPVRATVTTLAEFRMPSMACDRSLEGGDDIGRAVRALASKAGRETVQICLGPGEYAPFAVEGLIAQRDAPFIIRALDPDNKPVIDGRFTTERLVDLQKSANVWFDGLVLQGMTPGGADGGIGFRLDTCRGIVVRNSVITGKGRWGVLMNRCFQFPPGHGVENDANLVELNAINGLYNAVQFDNNDHVTGNAVGMGLVVRANTVEGGFDNFRHCGDEDAALATSERVDHYYRLTGWAGAQTAVNIDVYDNVIGSARDDNVEVDGVCSNYKFFRNRITGGSANTISVAPLAPGPNYFIGNTFDRVTPRQSFVKFNTVGGEDEGIATRNVFFYHNTMVRDGGGPALNLWWGHDEHSQPIKNVAFKNNVIMSTADSRLTDVKIGIYHIENPTFDYNHWFTTRTGGGVFEWFDRGDAVELNRFSDFKRIARVEPNGAFGNPGLYTSLKPVDGSPLVDTGVVIPGVNDRYKGGGPDKGASDVFHLASRMTAPKPAVPPQPKQVTTGLPAELWSREPRQTVTVEVQKPQAATRARVYLTVHDAEVREEGRMSINGRKPFTLFGDHAKGANNESTVRIGFETSAGWWQDGVNTLTFEHTSTSGFTVYGVDVEFLQ